MRLLNHASSILYGGHWGSSDLLIPEQQQLLNIIEKLDGPIDLPFKLFKMLIDWVYDGTHEGTHQLPEDILIINNLSLTLNDYLDNFKDYYDHTLIDITKIQSVLNSLMNINVSISNNDISNNSSSADINLHFIITELKSINERLEVLEELVNNTRIIISNQNSSIFKRFNSYIKRVFSKKSISDNSHENIISIPNDSTIKTASDYLDHAEKQAKLLKRKGIKF
jgi:hypothetical protein